LSYAVRALLVVKVVPVFATTCEVEVIGATSDPLALHVLPLLSEFVI